MCFISMYSVLNTLSEYTYCYIPKNITSYTFCLFLKSSKATKEPKNQTTFSLCIISSIWKFFTLFRKEHESCVLRNWFEVNCILERNISGVILVLLCSLFCLTLKRIHAFSNIILEWCGIILFAKWRFTLLSRLKQCLSHKETTRLICTENQLTDFYMTLTLVFGLNSLLEVIL